MGTRRQKALAFLLALVAIWLSMGAGKPAEICDSERPLSSGDPPLGPDCFPRCELPVAPPCVPKVVVPAVASPDPEDPPPPLVKISVRVPACAAAEQELEYHICVENCSAGSAHHVLVRNPLPANARFVRAVPEPSKKAPEVQWELGTMPGGERHIITLVLAAKGAADVTNCTRVQYEHGQCVTTRIAGSAPPIITEPPTTEPPKTKPPKIEAGAAKLALAMTGPKQQYVNLPAEYFITVTNAGTIPVNNVLITNKLPAQTTFVSAGQEGRFVANQVAWLVGTLEAGKSRTVEIVLRAQAAGEICNQADALAEPGLSAKAEACTLFKGASALMLEMVDRADPILVGGETSYPILVLNQGNIPVTNIRIKALIPGSMALTRAKGSADHKLGEKTPDGYQILLYDPLPTLAPGANADYEIYVRGLRPGEVRFKIELTADQLTGGPVREEESTTIIPELEKKDER